MFKWPTARAALAALWSCLNRFQTWCRLAGALPVALSNPSALFPVADHAHVPRGGEDRTRSLGHGKGADATYCMLGAGGLSAIMCMCFHLLDISAFHCLGALPLQISACILFKKAPLLRKILKHIFSHGCLFSLCAVLYRTFFQPCWDAFLTQNCVY